MRKFIIILSFLILSCATFSFAQDIKFGPRVGINLANYTESENGTSFDPRFGLQYGVLAEANLIEYISVQSGLMISGKGFRLENSQTSVETAVNPVYLEIPINGVFRYETGNNALFGTVGPYFGFGVAGKSRVDLNGDTSDDKLEFGENNQPNAVDIGFGLGGGVELPINGSPMQLGVNYAIGITNASDGSPGSKNSVFSMYATYYLFQL